MSRKKPTKSKETCKVYLKFIEIKKNFIKMSSKNVTGCNLQYLMYYVYKTFGIYGL